MNIFSWLKENLNCEGKGLFFTQMKSNDETWWDSSCVLLPDVVLGLSPYPQVRNMEFGAKGNSDNMSALAIF